MKKVSIILIDWGVRESFHSIDYLNNQTMFRKDYEIIWIEYYNHRPKFIQDHVAKGNIDKCIVLNKEGMYFKHLMMNEGIVASNGEIIVLCDSDAIYSPTFVESIVTTFDNNENIVLFLDQVRIYNKNYYPFKYIPWEKLKQKTDFHVEPPGLKTLYDPIHSRNYGSCFCATKESIIEMGGLDEHPSYHCFFCGAFELGWRMVNNGYKEIWHLSEWSFHTWHPWVTSDEIKGEHDGWCVNSTTVEILETKRIAPLVENKKIAALRLKSIINNSSISFKKEVNSDKELLSFSQNTLTKFSLVPIVLNQFRKKLFKLFKTIFLIKKSFGITLSVSSNKINKILIVTVKRPWIDSNSLPINSEKMLEEAIKSTGLVNEIEMFYFDELNFKYNQMCMSELLVKKCMEFMPDLVIFTPLSAFIDPTKESIDRIITDLRINVYAHVFISQWNTGLKYEWLPRLKYIGIVDSFPKHKKYSYNKDKFIYCYPAVNPLDFYDMDIVKDIDVTFWGSIPINSKRERYIEFLKDNEIKVLTRNYRVSVEEYSKILNRSKIVISFCIEQDAKWQLTERLFEGMACNSLVLEEESSGAGRLFDVGKDFETFSSKEDLLKMIKYYLQHEEERQLIAESGHKKATTIYNARNMWCHIFRLIGLNLPSFLLTDSTFKEVVSRLNGD